VAVLGVFALLLGPASGVSAQEPEGAAGGDAAEADADATERARELFSDGIGHIEEQRWEEAEASFRQAMELRDAPSIRYNLAAVLFELDELTEASVLVRSVLADPETPDNVREPAEELEGRIGDRGGTLRIELAGDTAGVTVAVDEYELPPEDVGEPLAASTGAHTITGTRDGRTVATETAEVAGGEEATVRLEVAPTAETAAAEGLEEEAPEEESASFTAFATDWRFWAVVGGVIVVTVGIALIATSGGVEDPVDGNFEPGVIRW